MQPPPTPGTLSVSYQMSRDVLIRIWWKRMLFRRRILGATAALFAASVLCFALRHGLEYAGFLLLFLVLMSPINLYRAVSKAVDNSSQHTDPKTVEFSSSRIVVTGPNWRSELPWTTFKGFSEDSSYFYLHLSDNGIASVLPKSAFTPELQQQFREYAKARNG